MSPLNFIFLKNKQKTWSWCRFWDIKDNINVESTVIVSTFYVFKITMMMKGESARLRKFRNEESI